MKAQKINEIIDWAEWKNINLAWIHDCLSICREVSQDILDWLLDFDMAQDDGWHYMICSVYKNIEWKQGYSCIINWDVIRWRDTPENFAKYIAKLYDRAMEILDD